MSEEKPRVHFLYDACEWAQSDPKYRLNIWCACHKNFGTDIAAALAHIPVDALPVPPSAIVQALAKSVTGARDWVAQAQHVTKWLLDQLGEGQLAGLQAQLENLRANLQR